MNNSTQPRWTYIIKSPAFFISWFSLIILSYFFIEKSLAFYFFHTVTGSYFIFINMLSNFGKSIYYLVGLPILGLFFWFVIKNKNLAFRFSFLLLSVIISGLLCDILKIIFGRSRPTLLFQFNTYGFHFFKLHFTYWSFPSGHATTISALATACLILWPRYWIIYLFFLLIVCTSRIMTTDHFLSDVMIGNYLGAITTIYLYEILKKYFWRTTL